MARSCNTGTTAVTVDHPNSVTNDGGWVGGPDRFTVSPLAIVIGTEAPEELNLSDSKLAGQEAAIPLSPGQGCPVLRFRPGPSR